MLCYQLCKLYCVILPVVFTCVGKVTCFSHSRGFLPIIEGLIVLLCGILVVAMCLREQYLQRTEVERNFISVFNKNHGRHFI